LKWLLCGATGASTRTLQRAFLERFGVSPKAYLMALRLNGLREELRRRSPDATRVGDVADHWGFIHKGALAADYSRLFGELPSETLRRRPELRQGQLWPAS